MKFFDDELTTLACAHYECPCDSDCHPGASSPW